jgi:hypothetical protein
MGQHEPELVRLSGDARRDLKRRLSDLQRTVKALAGAFGTMRETERCAALADAEADLAKAKQFFDDKGIWLRHFDAPEPIPPGIFEVEQPSPTVKHWLFKNQAFEVKSGPLFAYDVNRGDFRDASNLRQEQPDSPDESRRASIPSVVRREVWRRDQGRCVKCGSRERLEFDHIIPVSGGGSATARNIELLCEHCNRQKGTEIT